MEEIDVLDELEISRTPKRSVFLTVLCILTWVGSGGAMLYYGYQLAVLSLMTDLTGSLPQPGGGNAVDKLHNYVEWLKIVLFVKMLAPILTVIGAVFMFMLRRWGFYLYLVGQLVPVAFGIWFSLTLGDDFRGFSLVFTLITSVIPLGFVVMYAVNLKDMRK